MDQRVGRAAGGVLMREHAFTLVEMIIAMVVLSIVVGLTLPVVVNVLSQGARQSSSSATESQLSSATALLESDLRAMRAPARTVTADEDMNAVVDQLHDTSSTSSTLLGASGINYGVPINHDIIFAGPTMLEFWADIMDVTLAGTPSAQPDRRAELVRWYLIDDSGRSICGDGSTWCVVRDVRFGGGAGNVLSEVITAGQGAFPRDTATKPAAKCWPGAASPAPLALFCYRSRAPSNFDYTFAGWRPACTDALWGWTPRYDRVAFAASNRTVTRGGNHQGAWMGDGRTILTAHELTGPYSARRIHPLDRVTGIGVQMPVAARLGSGDSVRTTHNHIELRSRRASEYQTAILCGDR